MKNKWLLSLFSVILLSLGWFGVTGFTLFFALVPLLLISRSYDASPRSFLRTAGWAALIFGVQNIVYRWDMWRADLGAATTSTVVHILLAGGVFMIYHYMSKRARPALANVALVCGWIAAEYLCLTGKIPFPELILGNGFANDAWAVQWYRYTGVLGGTLWVLVANLLVFEFLVSRERRWLVGAGAFILVPVIVSLVMLWACNQPVCGIEAPLSEDVTFYTKYGDWPGRAAVYVFLLCLLYYVAYRYRRRSHLVE